LARIRGIPQNLKKEFEHHGDLADTQRPIPPERRGEPTTEQEVRRLRVEVEYLKQEQEFLKKIISAAGKERSR
jgi:hypothetical protein